MNRDKLVFYQYFYDESVKKKTCQDYPLSSPDQHINWYKYIIGYVDNKRQYLIGWNSIILHDIIKEL